MEESIKESLKEICGSILFDEPMARHTTIRVGGPADAFVQPRTIDELANVVQYAKKNKLPLFILGAGSNLLVRDKGIRGLVINLSQGFNELKLEKTENEGVFLYAESGVGVPRLVDFAAEEGLTGLEAIAGVPGNVGGAIMMNAGTPDGEIGDVVETVTFMDKEGRLMTWEKDKIDFGYRETHFPKGAVILSARFSLARMASEKIKGRVQEYRARRVETQPLNVPNLGSVFKNPVGAGRETSRPGARTAPLHAGKLIDEAGLKNIRLGGARISPKHGNFIVNEGGATAKDILALIGLVKDKVKEKFQVSLETEVKIVGEE